MSAVSVRRPLVERIDAVRAALDAAGLDGWLLHDFRGNNPIALNGLGLRGAHLTRRFWCWIPAARLKTAPTLIVHRIETQRFEGAGLPVRVFTGWRDMLTQVSEALVGAERIAMEIDPDGLIPYVSRVDAGTVDWVRGLVKHIESSAGLADRFLNRIDAEQAESHRRAVGELYEIALAAFTMVQDRRRERMPVFEHEVQRFILESFDRAGLTSMGERPIVAAGTSGGDPHYSPSEERPKLVGGEEVLLIDLWAKEPEPEAVWGDITWCGFTGSSVPPRVRDVFNAVRTARDAAFEAVRGAWAREERAIAGFEADRAARSVIEQRGFGPYFTHRTGHNIGAAADHGDGPHLDDLETHDVRRLEPGLLFSIEPGIYLPGEFGIRLEIDVLMTDRGPRCFTPMQTALIRAG